MKTALLIIDAQKDYDKGGALEIPDIEKTLLQIKVLLNHARTNKIDIIHIRHIEKNPESESFQDGSEGAAFIDGVAPQTDEKVITKNFPGSFHETGLNQHLQGNGIDTVFITGYSSFLCCDTTSREACQHGYNVYFVDDAIGEFVIGNYTTKELHQYTCAVQEASEFSHVINAAEALALLSA